MRGVDIVDPTIVRGQRMLLRESLKHLLQLVSDSKKTQIKSRQFARLHFARAMKMHA
jgi:hypothetical protein